MEKLGVILGLKAQDERIKFKYNIEENIGDVEMFLVLSTLKSIKEDVELSSIISAFTKGKDNDQYKLFENKFIKLFKEDNISSFLDYEKVEKRAINIRNKGSMIHDVSIELDSTYFEEIDKHRISIKGKDYFVSKNKIRNFIETNLRSFYIDVNHENQNAEFAEIEKIYFEGESRVIPVKSQVDIDFKKVFIGESEFTEEKVASIVKREIKKNSKSIFHKICNDCEKPELNEIKTINDSKYKVLTEIPFKDSDLISKFGNKLISKKLKNVIYTNINNKIESIQFKLFKGIIIYSKTQIQPDEFVSSIDWNKSQPIGKKLLTNILPFISTSDQLEMVKKYIDSDEGQGLSNEMEEILVSKIDLLVDCDYPLLSERTALNIIYENFNGISLENSYKLISKFYKDIFESYEKDYVKNFLFRTDQEKSNIINKTESKIVRTYIDSKEKVKEQLQLLQGKAVDVRTKINKIIEDKGNEISDEKYNNMYRQIVKYLNVVNHITENHDSKGSFLKNNVELRKWIEIAKSKYDYDLLDSELLLPISNKFKEFEKQIKEIEKHIDDSIKKKLIEEENKPVDENNNDAHTKKNKRKWKVGKS